MDNIVVIGAGVMGSALAIHLGNAGRNVRLWGTKWDKEVIDSMKETGKNESLGVDMPDSISYYYHDQLEEAIEGTKLIIIAVISKGMKDISRRINPFLKDEQTILSITKGIDGESLLTMSSIIENSLSEEQKEDIPVVKLGGPIIAKELAQGKYTEGVFASKKLEGSKYAKEIFRTARFRSSTSKDILGVDLCAAFKNTYAIGMGIIEGLEGDSNNPKAALMARGSIEMGNIVKAYGGERKTALGIAGIGDYYVTSQGGRNGKFGKLIGEGKSVEEAKEIMKDTTVEGLDSTFNGYKFLKELENDNKINMKEDTPLFLEIYNILYNNKSGIDGINDYWLSD